MARPQRNDDATAAVWSLLSGVCDPEIPVLSILNLGMVRDVRMDGGGLEVVITPTYSGCPALDTIEQDIRAALARGGHGDVRVTTVLSPAWSTDWIDEEGREKLAAYGIAPPQKGGAKRSLFTAAPAIKCPHCGSRDTREVSEFGSTACKALHRCEACREPFDYFKCL